jgi:hypothetical protein
MSPMEVMEPIAAALGGLEEEIDKECPFKEVPEGVAEIEGENVANDDLATQENDGGKLGRNLLGGSFGTKGTWSGDPPKYQALRVDTRRRGVRVEVPGAGGVADGVYGFTVAAHHLIPGDASLAPSLLKPLMTQDESVEIEVITPTGKKTKTKQIRKHIGYNVNGCHNGVWLPGNYYIRPSSSPVPDTSWSELGSHAWCLNYVAAVCKAASAQMHDTHAEYSGHVKDLLNKIADMLMKHECDLCEDAKINPPFRVKSRLYNLSDSLRKKAEASPAGWKRPWFTSDRWRDEAFSGGKPSTMFMDAYNRAVLRLLS